MGTLPGGNCPLDNQTVPRGALSPKAAAAVASGAWRSPGSPSTTATAVTAAQARAETGGSTPGARVHGARRGAAAGQVLARALAAGTVGISQGRTGGAGRAGAGGRGTGWAGAGTGRGGAGRTRGGSWWAVSRGCRWLLMAGFLVPRPQTQAQREVHSVAGSGQAGGWVKGRVRVGSEGELWGAGVGAGLNLRHC